MNAQYRNIIEALGVGILILFLSVGIASAEDAGITPAAAGTGGEGGDTVVLPPEIVITDDITPYYGPIGPGSPIYGLKLALENLDEALTFDTNERVMKQMKHAEMRISEAKALLLIMNNTVEAERALDAYFEKMDLTAIAISSIPAGTTGYYNAYQQHLKHQFAIEQLLQKDPDNPGLQRAYENAARVEEKFRARAGQRLERTVTKLNKITVKVVRQAEKTRGEPGEEETGADTTAPSAPDTGKGKGKSVGKDTVAASVTPSPTQAQTGDSGASKGKGKNGKGPST